MRKVSERLELQLAKGGHSIRWLALELERREVNGSSYGNVYAVAKGKTQPSLELIEAMAAVLGVNVEWLAFERGHVTDEHAAESASPASARSSWPWEHVRDGFRKGFGPGADSVLGISGERVGARGFLIARTARLLAASPAREALVPPGKSLGLKGAARVIGKALRAPLRALAIDPRGPILDDVMDDYVMSVCLALRQLFDHTTKEAPDAEA
jgi:hypothetical protein